MRYVIIVVLSVCLIACQSTGLKIGNLDVGKLVNQGINIWDVNNIDQAQEIQFGENVSAVLLGVRPLHSNKAINLYVNHVGSWLAANSSRPDLPWQFGVIDSDAINAFAAPGGYIFVTSAMLLQLDSEAELAAVLAHEISHVTLSHHLNALTSGTMRNAASEIAFVSAEAYQANTNASRDDRQKTAWLKSVSNIARELYSKGLAREDEFMADKHGVLLLAKAGYDPFAYYGVLQKIAAIAPDDSSLALLYKTHPTPNDRLDHIEELAPQLEPITGKELAARYQAALIKK